MYEIIHKVRIIADFGTIKQFNGVNIYQTTLYVNKYWVAFIKSSPKRHGCTDPSEKPLVVYW